MQPAELLHAIHDANARIRAIVQKTPTVKSDALSRASGAAVHLKLEHLQHTGSFKLRGASAKLTKMPRDASVVTASTGNHGLAVTYAAQALGMRPPRVFVPKSADAEKVERLRVAGAEVVVEGAECVDAEEAAAAAAARASSVYVSPYNDLDVVAGQGTLGLELALDLPRIDRVYVAVGGGGLIAGVAAAVKAAHPSARVIGCLPANSAGMAASIRAGRIVVAPEEPTYSDATAGGVESGSVTFPFCQALVDEWSTVTEDEIAGAWHALFAAERWVVEGAAAVPVAALTKDPPKAGEHAVIVLCGRNISLTKLDKLRAHAK